MSFFKMPKMPEMPEIDVNGVKSFGRTVVISNGRVIIDGQECGSTKDQKTINVIITGNLDSLRVDACNEITVNGDVRGDIQTNAGDVTCKDVTGDVSTMAGNIECANVAGSASTMAGNVRVKSR